MSDDMNMTLYDFVMYTSSSKFKVFKTYVVIKLPNNEGLHMVHLIVFRLTFMHVYLDVTCWYLEPCHIQTSKCCVWNFVYEALAICIKVDSPT